jgi:hypothetical protein
VQYRSSRPACNYSKCTPSDPFAPAFADTVPPTTTDQTKPAVTIMAPPNGAILKGHSSGLELDINGFAEDFGSGIQLVEIRTKSPDGKASSYQAATPMTPGDWSSWSTTRTLGQSGVHTISAKVRDNAGNYNWYTISLTIELSDIAPDHSKPIIMITSPPNGAMISGPSSGVVVHIVGSSSDSGSGVHKVELRWFFGDTRSSYLLATPVSPADWSHWSQDRAFTKSGTYTITAKASDEAGNSQWSSKTIHILLS